MNNSKYGYLLLLVFFLLIQSCTSNIEKIKSTIVDSEESVQNLIYLTKQTPARMSGSENNRKAFEYLKEKAIYYGFDTVWQQDVSVPYWEPGEVLVELEDGTLLNAIPLGLSVGTDGNVIEAELVEIKSKEELLQKDIKDKIVFYNHPMDNLSKAYSRVAWQRANGASLAAEKGARAVLVRSITNRISKDPHTGVTWYGNQQKAIPAIAIATFDANKLSELLSENPKQKIRLSSTAKRYENVTAYNLVAELKGNKHPNNIILLSAHIDSWFNSEGAQNNATGCVQVLETLRALKMAGITPENTIRALIYQDEEMMLSGIHSYIAYAQKSSENLLFNLEIDAGAGEPINFMLFELQSYIDSIAPIVSKHLAAYGLKNIERFPISNIDFWPVAKELKKPTYFYVADRNNYFSIRHSRSDNLESVDMNSMKNGAFAITSFVYLMDKIKK